MARLRTLRPSLVLAAAVLISAWVSAGKDWGP
jgi:hypothetical protein